MTATLCCQDLVVDPGAPARDRAHRAAGEDRGQGRGRGAVADAHIAGGQHVDPGGAGRFRARSTPTSRARKASSRVMAGSWAILREP